MKAFYNEFEPFAAEWLANLVRAGHITNGTVDARTILDVQPGDLAGYTRAHFFAGIGLWDHALALAGWPDNVPVWTGSCPCQPFSNAGARKGFDDERHLWPTWFKLIDVCRPPIVVGEQVSSPAGRAWLDLVFSDLEGAGYSCGAADLCAAGVGAPHRRQRLYWAAVRGDVRGTVAHTRGAGLEERPGQRGDHGKELPAAQRGGGAVRPLADPAESGCGIFGSPRVHDQGARGDDPARRGEARSVADAASESGGDGDGGGRGARGGQEALGERSFDCGPFNGGRVADAAITGRPEDACDGGSGRERSGAEILDQFAAGGGPWDDVEWLPCRDGVYRPTQPGLLPLAHGHTCRVGKLRAHGNAIVPQVAATFLRSLMDVLVVE